MKQEEIFVARYQTKADSKLWDFCAKLETKGFLHRYFVDRYHQTCAIIDADGKPEVIRCIRALFHEDYLAGVD